MTTFKIGDFVRSDTSDVFIGIIIDVNELGGFHVAWDDGDFTYSEGFRTMFHHDMKPSDWTNYLYKAFSDFFCP
tara:strand:+ start:265 stop:486 length:222 start_codon:yes stop_codon:yes gene_type:complete